MVIIHAANDKTELRSSIYSYKIYSYFFGVLISAPLLNLKRKFGLQTHNIHSVPTSIQIQITEKVSLLSGA